MQQRLTPEQLLTKYDTSQAHGKLTIFLGAAAGVGKTFSMLKAIPGLLAEGVDVVIGFVETHNRADTAVLVPKNVELIPLKTIQHKGHILHEVDIDSILARHPQLVILDELAHSNAQGSRNSKRYQDVLELLAAGIDVYSALNIQHIESLNDIVGQITAIKVSETVPDSVLEQAHEIKLIDVTPDELIERLREGKIYPPERARIGLANFFRKGNLTALREMALLKTAQKVEQQVVEYRNDNAIDKVWASHEKILVVVEPGYSSEKVIRTAKSMADKSNSHWYVVYVDNGSFDSKPLGEQRKVLSLFDLAKALGGETARLSGSNLGQTIVDFARQHNINTIILSQYRLGLYYRLFGSTLLERISELAPELNLHLVHDETSHDKHKRINRSRPSKLGVDYRKLCGKIMRNFLLFTVVGIVLVPLNRLVSAENILMLYFLVIIAINHGRGKLSALIAALSATVSFDFFFIEPRYSFVINDFQYLITFFVMAIVAVAFNVVNGNLRFQVAELNKAQKQSRLLYDASRQMAAAMIVAQVEQCIGEFLPKLFKAKFALLLPTEKEELAMCASPIGAQIDLAVARWVFESGQAAGLHTGTFAASKFYYLPINSQIRTRGVLVFAPEHEVEFFLPLKQDLLSNLNSMIATTLERIHFIQVAIQTEIILAHQG